MDVSWFDVKTTLHVTSIWLHVLEEVGCSQRVICVFPKFHIKKNGFILNFVHRINEQAKPFHFV
jgi:hypothetical protein